MRKLWLLAFIGLTCCTERGCTDTQMLNNNKRPYTVVSKAPPYTDNGREKACWIRLKGADGNFFVLNDCDLCRSYQVGDTLK